MGSVHRKLMDARMEFHATPLKKTGYNKFSNYPYFELHDFLPTILKIFSDKNMCGVVSFGLEIATLTITDIDDGGQIIIESPMSTANLKACHEVQNLGAVETYIRRYLWSAAIELVENDIIDSGQSQSSTERKSQSLNKKQFDHVIQLLKKANIADHSKFTSFFNVSKVEDIKISEYENAVKLLGKRIEANEKNAEKHIEDIPQ